MSDVSLGEGWWQATDGKWYAPELHPAAQTVPAEEAPNKLKGGRFGANLKRQVNELQAPNVGKMLKPANQRDSRFGNGTDRPLFEFQASRLKGGRGVTPNVIRVWPDRIEEHEHHAVRKSGTQSINFFQVAQVALKTGMAYSDITVESTGGHSIAMRGIPKADGQRVKDLIDSAVNAARTGARSVAAVPAVAAPPISVADEIAKLAALRDSGAITEEEFVAHKDALRN
jgi:Short C-terminal domain